MPRVEVLRDLVREIVEAIEQVAGAPALRS
jgi:hypothetical protein